MDKIEREGTINDIENLCQDCQMEIYEELAEKYDCITELRGTGLMQGLVFDKPVSGIISKALEKGLILINAGANIIRFVPPLIIEKEHVDEMIAILEDCIRS